MMIVTDVDGDMFYVHVDDVTVIHIALIQERPVRQYRLIAHKNDVARVNLVIDQAELERVKRQLETEF